ncbi:MULTISPECIES: LytR C-terminal domain-containing protein [unclassified Blastococcus]
MNRRRTDAALPDEPALPEDPADHPTTPGRSRADRRREGLLEAGIDPGRRPPRAVRPGAPEPGRPAAAAPSRPPADRSTAAAPAAATARPRPVDPPVPAGARPPAAPVAVPAAATAAARVAAPAPQAPAAAGPRTTVAPFQAVPTPAATEHPSAPLPDVSAPGWDRAWLDEPALAPEVPPTVVPAAPARPAAEPSWAPATPATPAAAPNGNPAYRDWTRPSGSGAAPSTTAIPEREVSRGRAQAAAPEAPPTEVPDTGAYAERFPEAQTGDGAGDRAGAGVRDRADDEPPAAQGPASGSQTGVVGGRAAFREERRAAEEQRRREARRNGVAHVRTPVPGTEDDEPRPARRRTVGALVAVVVVALLVLGVYSFTGPETQEAGDSRDQAAPTASAPVQTSGALPPLEVEPLTPEGEVPATPVRLPVTVLNATQVTGLAGRIADVLAADGWPTADTGAYDGGDVPVTTVYYPPGDEAGRQSAQQMVEAHPEVVALAERFFEVPGAAADGLVVVAAGDWQP